MGSSASVWLLNVAIFLGAEYHGGVALRVIRETHATAQQRQRVRWTNLSCVPAEVPERAAN
jgi:hypothetical protein